MRKYFFILIFGLFTSSVFSQTSIDTTITDQQVLKNDTIVKKDVDEGLNKVDRDLMRNNLDSFLEMQKERKAKEKRQAFIRIGIGIAFLIILIIGLNRRRKKAA